MEAGLIANLGAFFGVKIVLLCLSGDSDQGSFLDERSEEVFFSSSSQLLLVEQEEVFAAIGRVSEHGVTLVVCSRVNFTSQDVGGEIFGPDIIWLVSEESVNMEVYNARGFDSQVELYSKGRSGRSVRPYSLLMCS